MKNHDFHRIPWRELIGDDNADRLIAEAHGRINVPIPWNTPGGMSDTILGNLRLSLGLPRYKDNSTKAEIERAREQNLDLEEVFG